MRDHTTGLAIRDKVFGLVTSIDLGIRKHLEQMVFRSKQEQAEIWK